MTSLKAPGRRLARALGVSLGTGIVVVAPAAVSAHGLLPSYQSPLPLAVYLAGAAATVALSFLFVLARDMRAAPADDGSLVRVPASLRLVLRLVGLAAWAWVIAQGIVGGSSLASVATLFLWVYGWVGIAMLSAVVGPLWQWLDPFATLHDVGAWVLRRLGARGWEPSEIPPALRLWPAVAGIAVVVWLELVLIADAAVLTVVLAGYTALTLALMAQFGRDAWRAQGETFSVWFALIGRLAPLRAVRVVETSPEDPDADPDAIDPTVVRRRPFASGLFEAPWTAPLILMTALATGSIIFDGLSQTVAWATLLGNPGLGLRTLLLVGFLGAIALAAFGVARTVSPGAIGAGLVPIAVGYLFAHYLTYVLIDGQRIVIAVSDPLQMGSDLLGTAFYEPTGSFLPPGLVWTFQLAAVVGGHMLGAWAGHVTASRDADALAHGRQPRDLRHRKINGREPGAGRNVRAREVPLALIMIALTTLTLWSLGQAIVVEADEGGAASAGIVAPG